MDEQRERERRTSRATPNVEAIPTAVSSNVPRFAGPGRDARREGDPDARRARLGDRQLDPDRLAGGGEGEDRGAPTRRR